MFWTIVTHVRSSGCCRTLPSDSCDSVILQEEVGNEWTPAMKRYICPSLLPKCPLSNWMRSLVICVGNKLDFMFLTSGIEPSSNTNLSPYTVVEWKKDSKLHKLMAQCNCRIFDHLANILSTVCRTIFSDIYPEQQLSIKFFCES